MLAIPRGAPVVAAVGWLGDVGGTPPADSCSEDAVLTVIWG